MKGLLSTLFKYLKKKRMMMVLKIFKVNFEMVTAVHITSAHNNIMERALSKLSKNVQRISASSIIVRSVVGTCNKTLKKKGKNSTHSNNNNRRS